MDGLEGSKKLNPLDVSESRGWYLVSGLDTWVDEEELVGHRRDGGDDEAIIFFWFFWVLVILCVWIKWWLWYLKDSLFNGRRAVNSNSLNSEPSKVNQMLEIKSEAKNSCDAIHAYQLWSSPQCSDLTRPQYPGAVGISQFNGTPLIINSTCELVWVSPTSIELRSAHQLYCLEDSNTGNYWLFSFSMYLVCTRELT